jgi:predicted anti-sigma-YlaC factor YlaD
MTSTGREDCREIRQSLGVYVVGAIDPAERAQVDAHLADCPDCREELAGLAGLPALLHRVPVAEARLLAADGGTQLPGPPPEELLHSLLDRVAGLRRGRRWRTIAAAAAVAVLALGAGAAGGDVLSGGTAAPPAAVHTTGETVSGTAPGSGIHLTVNYDSMAWGTAMKAQVTGVPPGTVCQFRVVDANGRSSIAGTWRVSYRDEAAWYPVSTALADANLRGFQVTSNGKVLVSAAAR